MHTLEVSRIARTISRALDLNEDLTEAIALGHDLGHTPFGHAGERALSDIMAAEGGFRHNEQSGRVADVLENSGRGLNLTYETLNGIVTHTGSAQPQTREGTVVRLADRAAYLNHDADDAVRAGVLSVSDIPDEISCALGEGSSVRIDTIIKDVISESVKTGQIGMSAQIHFAFDSCYSFLFENLYKNIRAKSEETKVSGILTGLFGYYVDNPDKLPQEFIGIATRDGIRRAVCDYVAGMTDSYAVARYEELFVPVGWQRR
jgi:dGTPase